MSVTTDYKSVSDSDLICAVKRRDKDAFKEIMLRYQNSIYKIAYRFTGNEDASRDLTQDIFFKVYRHASSYTPDAKFYTWLYRVAVNHCINFTKVQGREISKPSDDIYPDSPGSSQADIVVQAETERIVRSAIDKLPERQRMAIILLKFEELSYKETAAILGCSVPAVEGLVSRAMSALKDRLSNIIQKES